MGMTFYQLALTLPKKKVLEIIRALLRQYPLRGHWRLRIMVWKEQHMVHHMLMILPYTPLKHEQYQQGIDVFVVPTEIKLSKRMANVKSLQYQLYDQAYQRAQINGASEALLLNKNNNVVEFSRGNIFYLLNHQWYTPPLSQGCLNGVVRQHVMRTVGPVVIKERPLAVKELTKVTGMLLTNSLIGSIPIRRILMG
jgi:branched-subunit amino acid aminotransferase/4-amino-4-deoxychorismate lyase